MYKDEIFALLGHNGAGKTTTISMLIGKTSATGGMALMDKQDIIRQRDHIGYCPQHDILFDYLTVQEHLYIVCLMRGVAKDTISGKIKDACAMVCLYYTRISYTYTDTSCVHQLSSI